MNLPSPGTTDQQNVGAIFGASVIWLILLAAICAVVLLSQSILFVGPQEMGVIYRFGALQEVVEHGTHWCWPYPIGKARKIPFGKEMEIRTGAFKIGLPQEALFDPPSTIDPSKIAYLVTADHAILHMENCILTYSIDPADRAAVMRLVSDYPDAKDFLGTVTEAGYIDAVRRLLEQSAIRTAAAFDSDTMLRQPTLFCDAILSELRKSTVDLGIRCHKVTAAISLPAQVQAAYNKASTVQNRAQRQLADARREAAQLQSEGDAGAAKVLADAAALKSRRAAEAEAAVRRFQDILPAYRTDPEGVRAMLVDKTRRTIFANAVERYLLTDPGTIDINIGRFKERPTEDKR